MITNHYIARTGFFFLVCNMCGPSIVVLLYDCSDLSARGSRKRSKLVLFSQDVFFSMMRTSVELKSIPNTKRYLFSYFCYSTTFKLFLIFFSRTQTLAILGINFVRYWTNPRNDFDSSGLIGKALVDPSLEARLLFTGLLLRNLKWVGIISRDLLYTRVEGHVKKWTHSVHVMLTFETMGMKQGYVRCKNNLVPSRARFSNTEVFACIPIIIAIALLGFIRSLHP